MVNISSASRIIFAQIEYFRKCVLVYASVIESLKLSAEMSEMKLITTSRNDLYH